MSIFSWLSKWFPKQENIIDTNNPRNGLIKSPVDYRDVSLGAISTGANPTPPNYQIPYKLTVKMQGTKSICAACVGSTMAEYLQRKEGNVVEFDEDWLYAQAKLIDGMPNFPGTYFRTILSVMKNVGCMPKGGDPKDIDTISKYRIAGYAQITPITLDNIRRAIYEHGTVLLGFYGSNQGWQTAMIRAPRSGEAQWGHAVESAEYCRISKIDEEFVKQGRMTMDEAIDRWEKGISRYTVV